MNHQNRFIFGGVFELTPKTKNHAKKYIYVIYDDEMKTLFTKGLSFFECSSSVASNAKKEKMTKILISFASSMKGKKEFLELPTSPSSPVKAIVGKVSIEKPLPPQRPQLQKKSKSESKKLLIAGKIYFNMEK